MTNHKAVLSAMVLAVLTIAPAALAQGSKAQQSKAQPLKAQPPKSVRLYVFDCGSLNIPDTSPYQLTKEELATTYMSVACFLVAHPKGTMMWDAGAVPD